MFDTVNTGNSLLIADLQWEIYALSFRTSADNSLTGNSFLRKEKQNQEYIKSSNSRDKNTSVRTSSSLLSSEKILARLEDGDPGGEGLPRDETGAGTTVIAFC